MNKIQYAVFDEEELASLYLWPDSDNKIAPQTLTISLSRPGGSSEKNRLTELSFNNLLK